MKYRKIAKTKFMFEVSKDGTVRNVKSKKIVNLTGLVSETWNPQMYAKPCVLNGTIHFDSIYDATRYVYNELEGKCGFHSIRTKLRKRGYYKGYTLKCLTTNSEMERLPIDTEVVRSAVSHDTKI